MTASIERLAADRAAHEDALVGGGPGRLLALRGAAGRIGLLRESAARLRSEAAAELAEAAAHQTTGPSPDELGRALDEAESAARAAARERDDLVARAELARQRLSALDGSLAEREGLPPAARALAESGEQLVLSRIQAEPGRERAVAAALGRLAAGIVAGDADRGLALVRQAQASGLGSLVVLVGRDPRKIVESLPVVEARELLASQVPAVTADGIGWDPARGELWFAGETAEALLLELEATRREHAAALVRLEEAAAASRGCGNRRGWERAGGDGRLRPCRAPAGEAPPGPGSAGAARAGRGAARRDAANRRHAGRTARGAARRPGESRRRRPRRARRPRRRASPRRGRDRGAGA